MNSRFQLRRLKVAARWYWAGTLCLLLSIVLPVTCSALETKRVQTCSGTVLRLRGDIREGDFSQLTSHFRGEEAILGFDLSSDGGVLEEGLRIADLTRRKKSSSTSRANAIPFALMFFLPQQNVILEQIQ